MKLAELLNKNGGSLTSSGAKSGSRSDSRASMGVNLGGRTRGINHYGVECQKPIAVADIEKLGFLVGKRGIALPALLLPGHVSHKWVKRSLRPALTHLPSHERAEIESLLSGGGQKWVDEFTNRIVNVGLDDYLDKYWKGSTYTAAHYVGLTDSTPTDAAGDTMSSHAGWTEVTAYSEGARQTLTLGSVSSQSVDNSASTADYTASGSTTVGGAFITTDSTKSGTSGTLITVGAFSGGDKSLTTSDTLSVTATLTMADS